jgi:hypothetical protein
MMAGFLVYVAVVAPSMRDSIVSVMARIMPAQIGLVIDPFEFSAIMLWAPDGAALPGTVPAVKAYRTAVAANLAPIS